VAVSTPVKTLLKICQRSLLPIGCKLTILDISDPWFGSRKKLKNILKPSSVFVIRKIIKHWKGTNRDIIQLNLKMQLLL
jgi:hypothetical protein